MDGCIICYSYPGQDDWNKKNILTTNFCKDCNVIVCLDCFKEIDGYKCPICHKQSHLVKEKVLSLSSLTFEERPVREPIPSPNDWLRARVEIQEREIHSLILQRRMYLQESRLRLPRLRLPQTL